MLKNNCQIFFLYLYSIKTRYQSMLRRPRPHPRGLAAPRSPVLATLRPARRPNSLRPWRNKF